MSCDITKRGSSLIRAFSHGPTVTFPSGDQAFPHSTYAIDLRVAARPNVIAAAALAGNDQPGNDHCRVVTDQGAVWDAGEATVGENPVAIRPTASGGFEVAYIRFISPAEQGRIWRRVQLSEDLEFLSDSEHPVTTPDGATTQGFSDWISDEPSFTDNRRVIKLGGVNFSQPMTRGEWTVGLHDDNRILLFDHASKRVLVSSVTSQKVARLELSGSDVPEVAVTGENLFLKLSEFSDLGPMPDPEPEPEPEPEPMPDPNLDHLLRDRTELVKQIRRELFGIPDNQPLNDARKVFQVAKRLASTLKKEGWGIVKAKPGSDNNVDGYTADIIALKDGEHVDIATSTETDGFASWQPARHKEGWNQSWNDAIAPRWEAAPDPNGGDPPSPPPLDTHRYEGGGNDTGTCDQCGRNRNDAIHAIPASKKPHAYDGGEQDTGQCDICQKPKGDVIHQPGQPQPDPDPDPPPTGDLGELVKLVTDVANAVEINRLEIANTKALVEGAQQTLEFVLDELKRLGTGGGSGAPTAFHGTGQARLIGAFPIDLVAGERPK